MASTYLTRTISTSTDNTKFTISVWVKKLKQVSSGYQNIINSRQSGTTNGLGLWFGDNDEIFYNFGLSSTASSACQTNAKYRDNSGWYHIVLAGDASQSGTDKLKFYVNGEQITSFLTDNRSSFTTIAYDIGDTTYPTIIGRKHDGTYQFDGLMTHFHFVDGTAYDASAFGETDANGVWKPKTSPSVTYGNNGFFILKDSGSVTDQSGNGNNWTVGGGTLTNTEDNPSNVFATFNPLWIQPSNNVKPSFSNGNLTAIFDNASNNEHGVSTLAVSSGKYYAEIKWDSATANTATNTGIFPVDYFGGDPFPSAYIYLADGTIRSKNSASSYGDSYTTGDIIGIALDLDNNKLYFSKNGTWQNSGDPTSGATGTGAISIIADTYYMYCSDFASSGNRQASANFGNGYFGTTAVASAGTNASGIGIFEYDVPTGYTALSTKGLNL